MIRFAVNLATRRVHASPTSGAPLAEYTLTRGDLYPIEIAFFRGAVTEPQGIGAVILKKEGDFSGDFLALCDSWVANGGVYAGLLNLNTVEATDAVGTAEQIYAAMEITWPSGGGEESTIPLRIVLRNDYLRGNEGVPQDALPPYPLPGVIVTEAPEDGKAYVRQDGGWVEAGAFASPDGSVWQMRITNDGVLETIKL